MTGTIAETLTPQDAARALEEGSGFVGALAERTAGLTWMIWGIATPGVFLTYAFFGALDAGGWWLGLAWVPWVLMAILATAMLWRSAALAVPALAHRPTPWFWARFLGYTVAITLLMYLARPEGPEAPLVIVGALWTGMGVLNLWNASPTGRRVCVAAGLPLVATGLLLAALDAPIELGSMVALGVSAAAPFLAGLWQTLRG